MTGEGERRLGRPPATESADTRQRLLDVARARFADLGYQSATNKEIAESSGITTGAIYHYFGSKRDLYEAVFEQVETLVHERYQSVLVEGAGFVESFERLLEAGVGLHDDDPSIVRFYVEVQTEAQRNAELQPLATVQARNSIRLVAPIVAEGIRLGEIRDDIEPRHVTYAMLAIMTGVARFSVGLDDKTILHQATSVLRSLIRGELLHVPNLVGGVA